MQFNRRTVLTALATISLAFAGVTGSVTAASGSDGEGSASMLAIEGAHDAIKDMESDASDAEEHIELGNYDAAYADIQTGENGADSVKNAVDAAERYELTAEEEQLLDDAEATADDAADLFKQAARQMEDGDYDAAEDTLKLAKDRLDDAADRLDDYID